MKEKDFIDQSVKKFLKHAVQKVLLIVGDNHAEIGQCLLDVCKEGACFPLLIDVKQQVPIEDIVNDVSFDLPVIFIFIGCGCDNLYERYHLERWNSAKVIVHCEASLLHPTLDASLYFAPLKGSRIQRHLFVQISLLGQLSPHRRHYQEPILFKKMNHRDNNTSPPSISDHFLNQKLLTKDADFIQMLADRVQQDNNFKDFLFVLIYASRNNLANRIGAANAITVLAYAKIPFSGIDFSKVQIPYADLSNAILDHTKFKEADLTNVCLRQTFLNSTDFHLCKMSGVDFGEEAYLEHTDAVHRFVFSRNGQWLVTTSGNTVNIWYWPQRKLTRTISDIGLFTGVDITPDDRRIVTSSYNKTVKIWEFSTGKLLHTLAKHTGYATCVKCSPKGDLLVSGGDNEIIIWDLNAAKYLYTIPGRNVAITSVDFSLDGSLIACGSLKDKIIIWHIATKQLVKVISHQCGGVMSVNFSPDNQLIVASGQDNSVSILQLSSGSLLRTFSPSHKALVNSARFNSNGQLAVSGSFDGTVNIWDVATGELRHSFQGHQMQIISVAFAPEDKYVVSSSFDHTLRVWDLTSKQHALRTETNNCAVSFSANGELLLLAGQFLFSLWNPRLGKLLHAWQPKQHNARPWDMSFGGAVFVENACLSPSGKSVLWTNFNDKNAHIAEVVSGKSQFNLMGHMHLVTCASYGVSDNTVVTGSSDKTVKTWNFAKFTGETLYGHSSDVISVCYSPNEQFIASASKEMIIVWSTKTNKPILKIEDKVSEIAFCPNNKWLIAYSGDVIKIWDLSIPKLRKALIGHTSCINTVSVSADNLWLASGSHDDTIRIWNIESGETVAILSAHKNKVMGVCFNPNDVAQLVSVSLDGAVICWQRDSKIVKHLWQVKWRTHPYLYCENINLDTVIEAPENAKLLMKQRNVTKAETNEDDELIRAVVAGLNRK